jgi:O-acetyl-ADP-ribose deacetylase (regulator of RNase III)
MIETRTTGNLFDCGAQAIVNTVNCVGVMGKGIALQFKQRYPDMYVEYRKLCARKYIQTGKVWVWHEIPDCLCECDFDAHDQGLWCACGCEHYQTSQINEFIINFPTKDDWRNGSKLEWIAAGLDDLKDRLKSGLLIKSLAMPALGCANGGLNFVDVKALVYDRLQELDNIHVILFEPQ